MTDLWMIWFLGFLTGGMATFFGLVLLSHCLARVAAAVDRFAQGE